MSDIGDIFKKQLRKKSEELEYSNSSNFLEQISEEFQTEIDNNKVLKFKKNLSKGIIEAKQKALESTPALFENITIEEKQEILTEEVLIVPEEVPPVDFIANIVDAITKESVKENYTNLFSQPDAVKPDPSIKALQDKLKMLEDWVSNISMAGPGGGAGDAINLSYPVTEVNSDYTMNRKDYCLLVNPSVKTYINLPPAYNERRVIIKDISGHAHLTPIHINGTIDNDPNGAEIRVKYAALQLIYKNNSWWVI